MDFELSVANMKFVLLQFACISYMDTKAQGSLPEHDCIITWPEVQSRRYEWESPTKFDSSPRLVVQGASHLNKLQIRSLLSRVG